MHGKKKLQGLVISLLASERKEEIVLSQMIEEIKKRTKHICSTMHNATTSN